jgi:uncharacterized protein (DUF4415 family)
MTGKRAKSESTWVDPDDAPAWPDEAFDRAEMAKGGKVIREASGTLTRPRGRPRSETPKQQVSLRLDQDVLEGIKATGAGWQRRVNDALRAWLKQSDKGAA